MESQGKEAKLARLKGAPFLLVLSEMELDENGYTCWVRAIEPFQTQDAAEVYAKDWISRKTPNLDEEQSGSGVRWHRLPDEDNKIYWGTTNQPGLKCVSMFSFTLERHRFIERRQFQLEILAVETKDDVDAEISRYLKDDGMHECFDDDWSYALDRFLEGKSY